MSDHIDFYFDIISPYAYIAYKKILKIKNVKFKLKPIFLGGLHNLAGIAAPAFNKYKMKNMQNDCELVAKKNNIRVTYAGSSSKHHEPSDSPYAMNKYLGEQVCKLYKKSFNTNVGFVKDAMAFMSSKSIGPIMASVTLEADVYAVFTSG